MSERVSAGSRPNLYVVTKPGGEPGGDGAGNGNGAEPPPREDPVRLPFRALGYDRDEYAFIPDGGGQVLVFSASALSTKGNLYSLAPLAWWERSFCEGKPFSGQAVDQALDFLIRRCREAGPFRVERLRGRGVWIDGERLVGHLGDRLLVDGARLGLADLESKHIYEARPALDLEVDSERPLMAGEGDLLHRWAVSLAWEQASEDADGRRSALDGTLLAGWIACASVCGSLGWRPHAFVTGPSGTGKSQVVLHVARHLLGDFALRVKSAEATAAGVRQRLGPDALAVTLDEMEADGESSERRIRDMLALMRVASSDDDAEVLKGGAKGHAVGYAVRSAFLGAAVRVPIVQRADKTRVSVLNLRKPTESDQKRFKDETVELMDKLMEPGWAARFRARMILKANDVRAAAQIFRDAATERLGDARLGDQYGALLGGAYVLMRDGVPKRDAAREWIARHCWDRAEEVAQDSDELNAIAAILESPATVSEDRTRYDVSIGELISIASRKAYHRAISPTTAQAELGRRGLRTDHTRLFISNTHRGVGEMLRGTSYRVGWSGVLRRLEGAEPASPLWYGGSKSRGTSIPLDSILGGYQESVESERQEQPSYD